MTNIALDLVGQARSLYQLAADIEGQGKTEDDLAYLRDVYDFKNLLLVEQPNRDFAYTIARQFFFSAFQFPFYQNLFALLEKTSNPHLVTLKGIVEKALKEVAYHRRWSSEWVIRLGDGTAESHRRMQTAIDDLWAYAGEAFLTDAVDEDPFSTTLHRTPQNTTHNTMRIDWSPIKTDFDKTIKAVLEEATIKIPTSQFTHTGSRQGRHSEHLGYILADMQFLQRAYPNATW